jgi:hypothetical protein
MFDDEGDMSDGESDFDDDEVEETNGQNSEQEELEESYESGVVEDDIVQRLKHDLFAEEEEADTDGTSLVADLHLVHLALTISVLPRYDDL